MIGGDAPLFGVHPIDAGLIGDANFQIGGAEAVIVICRISEDATRGEGAVEQRCRRSVFGGTNLHRIAQAVSPLFVPSEAERVEIHHVVHRGPLEGGENVVLVGGKKLVGRRHDVVGEGERQIIDRELAGQIGFLIERPRHLSHTLRTIILEAIGNITLQEKMLVKVGGGLSGGSQTQTVHKVLGNDGVHRSDVHLGGLLRVGAGLHEVFDESLQDPKNRLETFDPLKFRHESVQAGLRLRQTVGAVGLPEQFVLHLRIRFGVDAPLETELLLGQRVKGEVAVVGGSSHHELLQKTCNFDLNKHVVLHQDLLAGGQLPEVLNDAHAFHKIHVRLLRNAYVGAPNAVGAVCNDVDAAGETKVLRIVGCEVHLDALFLPNHQRVNQEIAIKRNGIVANRTHETMLQQSHIIRIDIHVGEAVLNHVRQNVTRAEEVVKSCVLCSKDDALLRLWRLAEYFATDGFIDGDGQNEATGLVAYFNMLFQERKTLELSFLKDFLSHVVESEEHLGVFVNGIEFMVFQVIVALGCNHFFHELHRRIVFP